MRYQTRFSLTAIALVVIVIAGLLVSLTMREKKPQSLNQPPIASDNHVQAEVVSEPSEYSTEVVEKAVDRVFNCNWNFESGGLKSDVVATLLSKSKNPEHLLMAALLGTDRRSDARIFAMTETLNIEPNNPLILWNFLSSCERLPDAPICRDQNIENRAIAADSTNGQLWVRIGGIRANRGNMPAALDALKNAAAAPEFNEYWIEHVKLFERGLAAATNAPYRERIIQAISMAAGLITNYNLVFEGCKTQAVESAEWLQLCTRLGERLEHEGQTMVSNGIGQSLQRRMYSISGDEEKQAAAEHRSKLRTKIMRDGQSEDALVLLSRDDKVLAGYISELASYGEIRAFQFLSNEVQRLKNVPGYDPCSI